MSLTIANCRTLLGWTVAELARRSGQTHGTIRTIEIGHVQNPSHAVVMSIMKAFQRGGLVGLRAEHLQIGTVPPGVPPEATPVAASV